MTLIDKRYPAVEERLNGWTSLAKQHKTMWVKYTNRGDMPPTVVAIKNGKPLIMVVAKNIDKKEGLEIARLLRQGFRADELIIFLDAHMTNPALDTEHAQQVCKKYSTPGSMQKACDEEAACAVGDITDALLCHRIADDGRIEIVSMPYDYHGKEGGMAFRWKDDLVISFSEFEDEDQKIEGMIPDMLRHFMSEPYVLDNTLITAIKKDFSPEQRDFYTQRAIRSVIMAREYTILEVLDIDANDPVEKITEKLESQYKKLSAIYDGIKPFGDHTE